MARLRPPTRVVPNMVPMIDIVSQLVIFFMLASQFISADVDPYIKLPDLVRSSIEKDSDRVPYKLVINVRSDENSLQGRAISTVLIGATDFYAEGRKANKSPGDLLRDRLIVEQKKLPEKAQLTLIIRADKRLSWASIQQVMAVCAKAGIKDVRLAGPVEGQVEG